MEGPYLPRGQHASTTHRASVVWLRTVHYAPARIIHRFCPIPVIRVQRFWGGGSTQQPPGQVSHIHYDPPMFFLSIARIACLGRTPFLIIKNASFFRCCLGTVDGTCPIGRLLNIEGRVTVSQCPYAFPFSISKGTQQLAPLGSSPCHLLLYPLLSPSISPSLRLRASITLHLHQCPAPLPSNTLHTLMGHTLA